MKTLLDFFKEHPDENVGRIGSAYTSCTGVREKDIYKEFEHTQKCYRCQDYIRSFKAREKSLQLSTADRQRVIKQMDKKEKEMLAES